MMAQYSQPSDIVAEPQETSGDPMPEYALLVRKMELAVQDATQDKYPDIRREAQRWIFGVSTDSKITAEYVANLIGLDIEAVRDAIKNRPATVRRLINQSGLSARAQRYRRAKKDQDNDEDADT